jgi:hypothetical protein
MDHSSSPARNAVAGGAVNMQFQYKCDADDRGTAVAGNADNWTRVTLQAMLLLLHHCSLARPVPSAAPPCNRSLF